MKEKPKLGCWWFTLIPLLLIALFLLQLMGPSPAVVVSPATTHITSPVGPDGYPVYAAYWQARAKEGITHENNAAVLIWKATWPGELSPEHYELVCTALGMEVPSADESLVSIYDQSVLDQINAVLPTEPNEDGVVTIAEEIVGQTMESPWSSEEIPLLAEWVEQNKGPLDLLVEGANRPKYYSPSPSFLLGQDTALISMLLPGIHGLRDAARCLIARAMWNVGEQRPMEAWRDLRATHLIARHAYRGNILVEKLVGIAIETMACSGTRALLHHGELSPAQAARIRTELESLPELPPLITAIDEGERLMFLDSTLRIATGKLRGSDLQGFGVNSETASIVASTRIDWNTVLKKGNQWYDRLVETGKLPYAQRVGEMAKIDADLEQLAPTAHPARLVGGFVSRRARSELIADTMLMLFVPSMGAATNAGDRASVQLELTRLAAALAVYRAAQAEYPENLGALVPDYLDTLPTDLFSGVPFLYERRGTGYLLYSVFENGVDDSGTDLGGKIVAGEWVTPNPRPPDRKNADLVVRLPRPKLHPPAN